LIARDVLDRLVGALDAGVEEDEKIDAADGDDPEKEKAERTELRQRIESRAEQPVEWSLDQVKPGSKHFAYGFHVTSRLSAMTFLRIVITLSLFFGA
jgi:hypothetical protein